MAVVVAWGRIVYVGLHGVELGPGHLDLGIVDLLARAALVGGGPVAVRVPPDVAGLLALAGLGRQVLGQAEEGEQGGVEEGVEPGDPVA